MPSAPDDHESSSRLSTRIAGVVLRLTPDCREVSRLTAEEREDVLPFSTLTRLRLHRLFCKYCARYAAQLELIRDASRSLPGHMHESKLPVLAGDAKARLKRALREQIGD